MSASVIRSHYGNATVRIATALFENLRHLRDRDPVEAEAVRAAIQAELMALTAPSLSERASAEG